MYRFLLCVYYSVRHTQYKNINFCLQSFSPLGFIRIYFSSKCELCSNKRTSYVINSIFLWFLNYFRETFIMFIQIAFFSLFFFFLLNSFKRTSSHNTFRIFTLCNFFVINVHIMGFNVILTRGVAWIFFRFFFSYSITKQFFCISRYTVLHEKIKIYGVLFLNEFSCFIFFFFRSLPFALFCWNNIFSSTNTYFNKNMKNYFFSQSVA